MINLQDELLDHLGIEDSVLIIVKDNLSPEVLPEEAEGEREVLVFVLDYVHKYGSAPKPNVISDKFGLEFGTPELPVEMLLERLRERHARSQAQSVLLEASRVVGEDPEGAIDLAVDGLIRIKEEVSSETHTRTDGDWDSVWGEYKAKLAAGMLKGKSLGFEACDNALGGVKGLTYVVARPKRYKSWLLLKSAVENRLMGERVSFFSLELSEDEMFGRYMCMMAGVSFSRWQHGTLTVEEHMALEETAEELRVMDGAFFCHRPPMQDRTVRTIERMAKEDEATFVLIDQLSWLRHSERVRADLRHREVEYINYDLKNATDHFPIYIAAQFNREADSLQEMADLSKIGLSDSIGQMADMVMGIYRNKSMAQNRMIQFGAVDSRGYEGGRWDIKVELSQRSNFKLIGTANDD